jgi:hypothetical protein
MKFRDFHEEPQVKQSMVDSLVFTSPLLIAPGPSLFALRLIVDGLF